MTARQANKYRAIIEQGAQLLSDAEALTVKTLYPEWETGEDYPVGHKVTYQGDLYKVLQAHTSQETWTPGTATAALYTRIDETHDGTKYDPIPYSGNMALEAGKYYTQGGVTYLCTRDTGNPVYQPLAALTGIYVEAV